MGNNAHLRKLYKLIKRYDFTLLIKKKLIFYYMGIKWFFI